ncbi:hypothetical protein ACRALDRAFT_1045492 [Sodiomyces alcalophilus JCM 7366]|uniref:uncharacterized protein n=1 Tax=Sodiomyces alcalophilus JCM 7366 TaxID=591952 RepID=UPI0039B36CB1
MTGHMPSSRPGDDHVEKQQVQGGRETTTGQTPETNAGSGITNAPEKNDDASRDAGSTDSSSVEYSSPDGDRVGEVSAAEDGSPKRDAGAVDRVLSKSSVPPEPAPDGGLQAWLVVVSGHLIVMNTWGVINSFGTFQTYYTTLLARPPQDISWIGSFQIFLLFFIGTFTGRLTDAGFARSSVTIGAALSLLGTFATSACTQYWQFFLAQGLCVGLGNGFLFCPSLAVLATWFQKRRSLAIGITASGSATGGLVFPSMVRELLPRIGFGWTMRAIGFIQLASFVVSIVFLRSRIKPRRSGKLVELAAFKEMEYTLYACGAFMCFLGVYFAFYYLASYARDIQGMSYTTSLNLLLILNGMGSIGRLVPNHIADRIGTLNVFVPLAGSSALLMYAWMAVSSPAGLYVWSVFYGFTAGGIQSMFPAALSALTTDPRRQGTRIGMVFTIVSFAVLIGSPICGAILSAMDGSYVGAQAFAGTALVVGMCLLSTAREVKRRKAGQPFWTKA